MPVTDADLAADRILLSKKPATTQVPRKSTTRVNPSISPRAAEATAEGTRGFAQWFQETFFPSGEDAPRTPAGDLSLATLALTGGDPQAEANRGLFPRAQEPGVAPDSGGILDETLDVGPNFVIREDGTRAAMFGESAPIKTQEDADARLADISRREMVVNAFENEFVMTPQSQAQVAQMREELDLEKKQLEVDLMTLRDEVKVQDVLFDAYADLTGLDELAEFDSVTETLQKEGALGPATFEAIQEIAGNAAMSQKEKNEAFNLILGRHEATQEMVKAINDTVIMQQHNEELRGRSDFDLLGNAAEFFAPKIIFDTSELDPDIRFDNNVGDFFFDNVDDLGVPPEILANPDHMSWFSYDALLANVKQRGVNDPETMRLSRQLANEWGISERDLTVVLDRAVKTAEQSEQAWETAAEALEGAGGMLKPGSPEMVAAIIEAGREAGYNDAGLELLAKSRDLHVLIETFSNGRSGVQEPGSSIAGVGGLTEEFYEAVMGEEWTPQRGLKWELQALITYIAELYGGDPMEALQDFALTGSWGGTATLG